MLSMHPPHAIHVGSSCFSFASRDGQTVSFSNLEPFDFHDEGDRPAMLLRIARFAESGVRRTDLQVAFGVGRATVQRAVNKLRDHGEAGFYQPRQGRGTSVIVGEMARTAEPLLALGMSGECARGI
ncbi:MAG: helix-turn-helix domain-containing protein [Alphaproteobacteria bacterium]|nr:helix-turn-helix domain-containing protein [Alphaproteobacteria bacterium]